MPRGKATTPRKVNPRFNVMACRKALGLSQVEMAKELGVVWQTVLRWERHGISPTRKHVRAMRQLMRAKAVGIPAELKVPHVPHVRRKLPPVTAGVGIAPSSL